METTNSNKELEQRKQAAWKKAGEIPGYDPQVWRRDGFNSAINYQDFGKHGTRFGWEIDCIVPGLLGGGEHPKNLTASHWRNRRGPLRYLRYWFG